MTNVGLAKRGSLQPEPLYIPKIRAGRCVTRAPSSRALPYCHCRMCQRAAGGPFVVFAQFARDSFRITGEPKWYRSSEMCDRGFCVACGTPLLLRYRIAEWSEWILSLGRLTRSSRSRAAAAALRSRKHDSVARECYSGRFIEEHLEDDRANPDRGPSGFRIDTPDD